MKLTALSPTRISVQSAAPRQSEALPENSHTPKESFQSGAIVGAAVGTLGSLSLAVAQKTHPLVCLAVPLAASLVGGLVSYVMQNQGSHNPTVTQPTVPDTTPPVPTTPEVPPQPVVPNVDDFILRSNESVGLLGVRAEAGNRYLKAETLYSSMKASASILDGPKDEMKELNKAWNLLPSHIDPAQVDLKSVDEDDRHKLLSLQNQLLEIRGEGQQVFQESGQLRDGLYVAKDLRSISQGLIQDSKSELERVQAVLTRLASSEQASTPTPAA